MIAMNLKWSSFSLNDITLDPGPILRLIASNSCTTLILQNTVYSMQPIPTKKTKKNNNTEDRSGKYTDLLNIKLKRQPP